MQMSRTSIDIGRTGADFHARHFSALVPRQIRVRRRRGIISSPALFNQLGLPVFALFCFLVFGAEVVRRIENALPAETALSSLGTRTVFFFLSLL